MVPNDVVWEILRWIPVKSLMRFKCVSRTWLSIIRDLRFSKIYSGGGGPCLISFHSWIFEKSWFPRVSFDTYTRFEFFNLDSESFDTHIVYHGHVHGHALKKACTNIVDGLICFYRGEQSWLYNIATREMVKLPDLTFGECKEADHSGVYNLGYDPITKRYKLLNTSDNHAAILTIGVDSLWRNIPPSVTSIDMRIKRGACLDGNICWESRSASQNIIISFNLAQEKFIQIESFLVLGSLINFGPSLMVTRCNQSSGGPDEILYYDYNNGIWIKQPFMPPRTEPLEGVHIDEFPCIVGVFPNGKVLMLDCFGRSLIYQYYLFDLSKKEWKPIATSDSLARRCMSKPRFYFEENIISLAHLTSCDV
ncbi:OLC1v1006918C1 [Oldenlandia corymbosa var. corymbosa]|uniref:OLC1v1006918C1 n=1 Tax=Oldenlandia corymbosa var. corymbosa TaxID=529605 RepID=A0AAV1DIL1_OLDCO|nr:OLC1v1006918C1 [Oldenlandia corymbosa var. corymbosa]